MAGPALPVEAANQMLPPSLDVWTRSSPRVPRHEWRGHMVERMRAADAIRVRRTGPPPRSSGKPGPR